MILDEIREIEDDILMFRIDRLLLTPVGERRRSLNPTDAQQIIGWTQRLRDIDGVLRHHPEPLLSKRLNEACRLVLGVT